jgi:hypothetical protein
VRLVTFHINGRRYQAPEAWLMGACQSRERRGMDCLAAYEDAIQHWAQQAQMAEEWRVQHDA